jgi:phosphoserine phosphatase RsbU/P
VAQADPFFPGTQSAERLALLARLSQHFSSSLDLGEVLDRVMDEVIAAVGAERGFVMLKEPDGTLSFRVARGMDQRTISAPGFQVSRGVTEQVARDGQPVLTSDAQQDDRFSMRQSIMTLGLRAILCVPLVVRGQVTGVVYVDNRLHAGLFTPADLELLVSIASSAAIAIENARLYQAAVEKGRLERELQMAREVQAGLLPQRAPVLPGWELAARWYPARQVAGDYYDFIPLGADRLGIVIADVADKGMPAALFMALTRSIVRASLIATTSPADAFSQANRLICADASGGMFITLFYAEVNASSGTLTYLNAGHNPALLCRGTGEQAWLSRTGIVLGMVDDAAYETGCVQLAMGDSVLLYTDGVTEAGGPAAEASSTATDDDMYGEDRLLSVVSSHRQGSAADLVTAVEESVRDFVGPVPPADDVTLVALKRVGR